MDRDRHLDYSSLSNGRIVNLPQRHVALSAVTPPPPHMQQDASTWNSPPLGASVDLFDFTTATAVPSIPSFTMANASAIVDMPFPQPTSPYSNRNSQQSGLAQGKKGAHDTKRIKVESPPVPLDSIDSWLQFDDDAEKFGSFEIDYSKRYAPAIQNRPSTGLTPGLGSGLYSDSTVPFREEDFLDDSAFDHSLSDDEDLFESMNLDEQLSKVETLPPSELPSGRGLYSTPLSWDRPQPGIPPTAVSMSMSNELPRRMASNAWDTMPQGNDYALSANERRRLIEIAMGPGRMSAYVPPNRFGQAYESAIQLNHNQEFGLGIDPGQGLCHVDMSGRNTSADTTASGISQANRDLKHKQPKNEAPKPTPKRSNTQPETGTKEKQKSADRMAHNDVERKYRTNLKDKITELRNAVPALHQAGDADGQDGEDGAQGGAKVSKGTVLTKATEYIHQLEQRNKDIMTEHRQLMRRIQAFEALLNSSMRGVEMVPSHSMALFDPRGFC